MDTCSKTSDTCAPEKMEGEGTSSQNHDPGHYNFTVRPGLNSHTQKNELTQKSVEFKFSTKLNCLYVKKLAVCPFGISTSDVPPEGSRVKIHVFSADNVPVMRCKAHTSASSNFEGVHFVSPWHFMRCDNDSSVYHCDESGELSIYLPYIKPECVAENVENVAFLCSSQHCIKKQLFIKFSLMNCDEILGYQIFGLHVCSSPGRDYFNHEAGKTSIKRRRKNPAGNDDPGRPSETALPPSQERYQLLIKKEWICQYILKINRGLDLMEAVPLEDQERYLRRYRAGQDASSHRAGESTSSSDTRTILRRVLVKC